MHPLDIPIANRYERLVVAHDLTFVYSDDHSVYLRGRKERDDIQSIEEDNPSLWRDFKIIWNSQVDKKIAPDFRKDWYRE